MKLIIEYDEEMKTYLRQYISRIEYVGKGFAAIEVDKKYLKWINSVTKYAEANSIIQLKKLANNIELSSLEPNDAIIGIIGLKQSDSLITHYYNIDTSMMDFQGNNNFETAIKKWYINCFSENNITDTIGVIKCISFLTTLSKERHKPLIIYAYIDMLSESYGFTKLFYEAVSQHLEDSGSILVIKSKKGNNISSCFPLQSIHKNYPRCIIEDTKGINDRIRKAISNLKTFPNKLNSIIYEGKNSNAKNKDNRQIGSLYNDYFYLSIDPNEEIYLPLLAEAYPNPQYYEELGFLHISLESGLRMLYGKKSEFDRHSEHIRSYVVADYRTTILTHAPCMRDNDKPSLPYFLPPESQIYTGKGVYIGIITADDIDYTNIALRNQDGTARIAYIWEQLRANQGNTYTTEQINAALASPNPNEIIRLPASESMSTLMAAISGGYSDAAGYRGMAPEAEFLIAKIRPISENLQRIYGGMPNPRAIILHDALIGILELIGFALKQGKPLVLIMPFNGNIDSHDAALLIQQQLSTLARRTGLTIIVPTGDEANKQHHFDILGEQVGTRSFNLQVEERNQNVVVVIYQWGANMQTTNLYPPAGITGSVDLKQPGVNQLGSAKIYSSGENISYVNGTFRTLFRIENPDVGQWRIESDVKMGTTNRVEVWISQEELNPHVKLNPNSALLTMGSTSAIPRIMSVGGYDANTSTVIRSSGRGDMLSSDIIPLFVTYGKSILAPCSSGEWIGVTGTVPAASFTAGAVATIYQKHIEEGNTTLPNTILMNSIITRVLTQFETLQYPDPSQGYGVFNHFALARLLRETT